MSRTILDRYLEKLRADVVSLGDLVNQALTDAVKALAEGRVDEARRICREDELINKKRLDIEKSCMETISTQQPLARDARFLAGVLEVATELERMGDYAKEIALIASQLPAKPLAKLPDRVPRMMQLANQMLRRAMQAFSEEDADAAREIAHVDDQLDTLCRQAYKALLLAQETDVTSVSRTHDLLTVVHDLERFADRIMNICERTGFVVTGQLIELDQSSRAVQELLEAGDPVAVHD